ncbi:hypothetical protein AOX55_0000900 [Sinorhizobium fredii CCBAU 25509]|nr:hypothetical protein AOX55_0000900 [Sinorhizobium fredii CCBAU 25509]
MDFHRFTYRDNGDGGVAGARARTHVDIGGGKTLRSFGNERHERERTNGRRAQECFPHRYFSHRQGVSPVPCLRRANRPSPSKVGIGRHVEFLRLALKVGVMATPGNHPSRGCRKPE